MTKEAAALDDVTQPMPRTNGAEVDMNHSNDTLPSIDISLCENGMDHQEGTADPHDSTEMTASAAEGENIQSDDRAPVMEHSNLDDSEAQMPDDSTDRLSPDRQVLASTPKDKSASFQDLEVSSFGNETHKPLEKSKSNVESFKKLSVTNLRASFRSSFRRNKQSGKQNGSVVPQKGDEPFDTASLCSQNSEKETVHDGSSSDLWCEADDSANNNQLDRQKSRSTLSITSFTRLNLSLRLSSKKASQVMRRIGSKKNKVSRSETSTPEPSRRLPPLPPSVDTTPKSIQKSTEHDDASLSPHSPEAKSSSGEDSFNRTPYTRKSIRNMFKPRSLRTFRSLGDTNTKSQLEKKDSTGDTPDGADDVPLDSRQAPQNPIEIQGYLSDLGKAHLKAELLAYANIPIKVRLKWQKEVTLLLQKLPHQLYFVNNLYLINMFIYLHPWPF